METSKTEFRAVIKFLTKEGVNATEIHKRMTNVYGKEAPQYSTGQGCLGGVTTWIMTHGQEGLVEPLQ